MSKQKKQFNNFQDLGKHFGISSKKETNKEVYRDKKPFLGRTKELALLQDFIEDPQARIFGLYGTPMIGKTMLVRQFVQTTAIKTAYQILSIQFQNPENPETTLRTQLLKETSLQQLQFDQATLIVIENFEECLEWSGDMAQLHNIRATYALIRQVLEHLAQLPNIKVILESRFQINTFELNLHLHTLPQIELQGVDPSHFEALYEEEGVAPAEFETICTNFNNHTWLLSLAYEQKDWLFRNVLRKAASKPQVVTAYFWNVLEKIVVRLHRSERLLLAALTLKSSIPYDDFEEVFSKQAIFKQTTVFETLHSLDKKFLIQERADNYDINPYIREVCFSLIKSRYNQEIESLKQLSYFATVQEPKYDLAKQNLERGNYHGFFQQIRKLRRNKAYNTVHEVLKGALELPFVEKGIILNEIGITYKEERRLPEAIEVLKEAMALGNTPSYNELAIIHKDLGKYEEAIDILNQAFEIEPNRIESLNELGIIYRKQENYKKAIQVFEQALEIKPNDAKTLNELGMVYRAQEDYEKAIETFQIALNKEPNNVTVMNELAIAYHKQGQNEQAIPLLKKAIELGNKPSKGVLKSVLKQQKKIAERTTRTPAQAKKQLNKLLSEDRLKQFIKEYEFIATKINNSSLQQELQAKSEHLAALKQSQKTQQISQLEYTQAIIGIRTSLRQLLDEFEQLIAAQAEDPKEQGPRPIKILMLTSNPLVTHPLNLDKEHSKILARLQDYKQKVELERKCAINRTELKQITETYQPTILHFSGHGLEQGILVQNEDKNGHEILAADKLRLLFEYFKKEFQLELVLLNCCYSEAQARAIAQHVPFVIGTTIAVGDENAISFSTGFYFKYVQNRDVLRAFESGRTEALLNQAHKRDFILFRNGEKMEI